MKVELYSFLLDNKFNKGVMFKKSIEQFVEHYEMVGLVQEETLMKEVINWSNVGEMDRDKSFGRRRRGRMRLVFWIGF